MRSKSITTHDVAIVGGSFAGLSAALHLARARRSVVIFDHGQTRNRFSAHGHGFLGMDGLAPAQMQARGRKDVLAYPTVAIRQLVLSEATADGALYRLTAADGAQMLARKVILACGMRDSLPAVEGLEACWGKTAVHCPYCHGYELADRPTGVLMVGEPSLHQVRMLQDWTDRLTLFTNGHWVAGDVRSDLGQRGIELIDGRVTAVEHADGAIDAVVTEHGRRSPVNVLYLGAQSNPASPFAEMLGCAMTDGPFGPLVQVDEFFQTSVDGVFAAGDLTRPMFNAIFAAADGAMAGIACHRSLLQ